MRVLVTGGMGFIGSNFIRYAMSEHADWEITNLDRLTYAGNPENLKDLENDRRYRFIRGDIADSRLTDKLLGERFDVVVNLAAESHVDRSILDAAPFIRTNIDGVRVLLEGIRRHGAGLFLQVSTDEVYGSLGQEGSFTEESPLKPSSPYAASKAAAELLCRAYQQTYRVPIVITRCSNNYGPFQFPEKFIPLAITSALADGEIPVYGDGLNVRDWIFVADHCRALDAVIRSGRPGETYNIAANNERTNLAVVRQILAILKKPDKLVRFVTDRSGHDRRYALDTAKISRELGFQPDCFFDTALKETISWYQEHEAWWQRIKSGEYRSYYKRMYSGR